MKNFTVLSVSKYEPRRKGYDLDWSNGERTHVDYSLADGWDEINWFDRFPDNLYDADCEAFCEDENGDKYAVLFRDRLIDGERRSVPVCWHRLVKVD